MIQNIILYTGCVVTLFPYLINFFWRSFPIRGIMWMWVLFSPVMEIWIKTQDDWNWHKSWLQLYFQHSGKLLHFSRHMMEYLNKQLPGQWICQCDLQNWPTWSLDITMLDFHVWNYMKNIVCEHKVNRIGELHHQIFNAQTL